MVVTKLPARRSSAAAVRTPKKAALRSPSGCVFNPPSLAEYTRSGAWGIATAVDIHGCDPAIIRDADAIKRFTKELCVRLKVKAFGEAVVVDFGEDPRVSAYSLVQLIETSLISGHFANQMDSVYLDVFSCKFYEAQEIIDYATEFFKGTSHNAHCLLRGCDMFPKEYLQKFAERNIVLNAKMLPRVPALASR